MLLSFSAAPSSARWHHRPSRQNVPKSCQPGPGLGLPQMAPRGRVPSPPRAELGPGPTDGTRGGRATGPATSHFPLGCREDVGSTGVCINTALLHSQPGGDPPTPPSMITPGKMLAGREATEGQIGETIQGEIYKNCCVRSSPRTRDLHCPLLTSCDSGRRMGWRAQGGRVPREAAGTPRRGVGLGACGAPRGASYPGQLPSPKTSLSPIPL